MLFSEMDKDWLKTQLQINPDRNKAGLARALAVEPSAVSKILAGTRQIKAHEYVAMRRYFGLPTDGERAVKDTADISRSETSSYKVEPLQDAAGTGDHGEAWIMPASLLARRTQAPPGQVRIFSIRDRTMVPDFLPGEHVLVDLSDRMPSPAGIFIISDGVGHMLRQCEIIPGRLPLTIRLSAANSRFDSHEIAVKDAGLVGRVIAKLQWL